MKNIGKISLAKIIKVVLTVCAIPVITGVVHTSAYGCTSAIIGPKASANGKPLLWKHRDTSNIDNKVEYINSTDSTYGYVALFNAGDMHLKEAWTGMNSVGFAIMNTASYNIKDDNIPEKMMDKEGYIMTAALKKCMTVDDFEELLKSWKKPMGVEANFGVIDAYGNGAYFETNNTSFVKYDIKDAPGNVLVRTNYSHSGREGEGYGHIREANAEVLLQPHVEAGDISAEILTEELSRSFYHDGRKEDATTVNKMWVMDKDFIPRYKSTATIVIEGCIPLTVENANETDLKKAGDGYIMWTGLGYPPVAEIFAVRCNEYGVPSELTGNKINGHSIMSDKAKALRNTLFRVSKSGKGDPSVNVGRLYNTQGTGLTQEIVKKNLETYRRERGK